MFALKFHSMFVRASDGLMTDKKESAMLFHTVSEAQTFIVDWRKTGQVDSAAHMQTPVEIVEVETKVVVKKFLKVVAVG